MSQLPPEIKVLFVAGFGPIAADEVANRRLFVETLRLPLEAMENNPAYLHTQKLQGVRHFAVWPLSQASLWCFGSEAWPENLPVPQYWLEFDVADLDAATTALEKAGYQLLVRGRREPWGQSVTRLLAPDGGLLAVTYTPWMRDGE